MFLPSIARFRVVYLGAAIESGTPGGPGARCHADNMVTEEVKRSPLNNAGLMP